MDARDLHGEWREPAEDPTDHRRLRLLADRFEADFHTGGDCGGTTTTLSGPWVLTDGVLVLHARRWTERTTGTFEGGREPESGPVEQMLLARVQADGSATWVELDGRRLDRS